MTERELLACPFCGGLGELQHVPMGFGGVKYRVNCQACECRHPLWDTAETAKREWNTRAAGDAPAWQPIETAPKDGTAFLAWRGIERGPFQCWWNDDGREAYWMDYADTEPNPTHWQPLPAPPVPRPARCTESSAPAKVCLYHDGCPAADPACHLCAHVQP